MTISLRTEHWHCRWRFMLAVLVLASMSMVSTLRAQGRIPGLPSPPTEQACQAYLEEMRTRYLAITREVHQCMRGPTNFGSGVECGSGHRVFNTVHAWNQCFRREPEKCQINAQIDRAYQCLRDARMHSQSEHATSIRQRFEAARDSFDQARRAFDDPRRFIEDWVVGKVSDRVLKDLRSSSGALTPLGTSRLQESYEYIFNGTVGEPAYRSSNPVIAAIQGDSAERIRNAHLAILEQMDTALFDMDRLAASDFRATRTHRSSQVPRSGPVPLPARMPSKATASECAVLTGPGRSEFADSRPEEFQALYLRCKP